MRHGRACPGHQPRRDRARRRRAGAGAAYCGTAWMPGTSPGIRGTKKSTPAYRRNASRTVNRRGSAKGSASRPRKRSRVAPAASAASRSTAAQSRVSASSPLAGAIPFEHGELGRMQGRAFAVAEHPRQREDAGLPRRQQLLHREFRRGVQVGARAAPSSRDQLCGKPVQMRFVAGDICSAAGSTSTNPSAANQRAPRPPSGRGRGGADGGRRGGRAPRKGRGIDNFAPI